MKRLITWSVVTLSVSGCGIETSQTSKVAIRFPETTTLEAQTKGSVSALAIDWSRACFAVNVTGSGIPKTLASACDVPTGVFSGAVPPGGTISIDVPSGAGRKLEVFAYTRKSGELCRQFSAGFGNLERERLARVGEVPTFDALEPTVSLAVQLVNPANHLVVQYGLPAKCIAKPPAFGDGSARIGAGYSRVSGSRFVVEGRVNGHKGEAKLQGGRFKVELSRSSK